MQIQEKLFSKIFSDISCLKELGYSLKKIEKKDTSSKNDESYLHTIIFSNEKRIIKITYNTFGGFLIWIVDKDNDKTFTLNEWLKFYHHEDLQKAIKIQKNLNFKKNFENIKKSFENICKIKKIRNILSGEEWWNDEPIFSFDRYQ